MSSRSRSTAICSSAAAGISRPACASRGIFKAFDHVVDAIGFSADGAMFATADGSAEVKLWDAEEGRLIDQLPTSDELACVTFVDDTHVVAGGRGGHLELFDLSAPVRSIDELVRLAGLSKWRLDHGRAVER